MILLDGNPINITKFPDHTSQVWELESYGTPRCQILWKFEDESEIIHLTQLIDLLTNSFNTEVYLHIPYLPYARQDKPVSNVECFGLHSFEYILKLWKNMGVKQITANDIHGRYKTGLIQSIYPNLINLTRRYDYIIYPDLGAARRYSDVVSSEPKALTFEKVRSSTSGAIISHKLIGFAGRPTGRKLIIDDICDGGATFISIVKQLGKCDLYVSHGLFTRGRQVLHDAGIEEIFTFEDLE